MELALSAAAPSSALRHRLRYLPSHPHNRFPRALPPLPLPFSLLPNRHRSTSTLCFSVTTMRTDNNQDLDASSSSSSSSSPSVEETLPPNSSRTSSRVEERMVRKRKERQTYLAAAIISSVGFTSMAVAAVYYRFYWQMEGGEIPVSEMVGTFSLSVGAAVGMEFWARWAHRSLWHASLWKMHESHHRPREGPFELNDVFAVTNAVPAIALLYIGFFHTGFLSGLCFGAGLGITLFGMAYMFVHDGLVHRRFPVGPIAHVPYFQRVAAAHRLHHSEKFEGVPYGLFLGPQELKAVGGSEDLEKEVKRMKLRSTTVTR